MERKVTRSAVALIAALVGAPGVMSARDEGEAPRYEVAQIDEIRAAVGKRISVRGPVESTGKSKGSGMNFLNFPGGEFTAVVFARSLKNFPDGEPADRFEGKWVEVTGELSLYKEKPQIVLEAPGQIVELDPETQQPVVAEEAVVEPAPEPEDAGVEEGAEGEAKPREAPEGKVDPRLYFDDP